MHTKGFKWVLCPRRTISSTFQTKNHRLAIIEYGLRPQSQMKGHIAIWPKASKSEDGHIPIWPKASKFEDGHIQIWPKASESEDGHMGSMAKDYGLWGRPYGLLRPYSFFSFGHICFFAHTLWPYFLLLWPYFGHILLIFGHRLRPHPQTILTLGFLPGESRACVQSFKHMAKNVGPKNPKSPLAKLVGFELWGSRYS